MWVDVIENFDKLMEYLNMVTFYKMFLPEWKSILKPYVKS